MPVVQKTTRFRALEGQPGEEALQHLIASEIPRAPKFEFAAGGISMAESPDF